MATLSRSNFTDRAFDGIDLGDLPPELQSARIVTAEDLARDGIGIAQEDFPEGMYLVPKGAIPDHLGQAVALLLYNDLPTLKAARSQLLYEVEAVKKGATVTPATPYIYQPETSIIHLVREGPEPYEQRIKLAGRSIPNSPANATRRPWPGCG
jgi:hypothetical protein